MGDFPADQRWLVPSPAGDHGDTEQPPDDGPTSDGGSGGVADVPLDLNPLPVAVCGDGVLDPGESCDDGNLLDADGCESDCTLAKCQNGVIDPGEWCFTAELVSLAPVIPSAIALGDLDADDLDEVVVASASHNVLVTVSWTPVGASTVTSLAGLAPSALSLVDGDGDGVPEPWVLGPDGVMVLQNDGGQLGPASYALVGQGFTSFAAVQLDLDGRMDLMVAKDTWLASPNQSPWHGMALHGFLGQPDGSFLASSVDGLPGAATRIVPAPVTDDGLPDLMVATVATDAVRVFTGSKVGHVDAVGTKLVNGLVDMTVFHANDDGAADVAVAAKGSPKLLILVANGSGGFEAPKLLSLGVEATSLATADFNGDGIDDLAVGTNDGELHLVRGHGQVQLTTQAIVNLGGEPVGLAVGDLDGNGLLDVAAAIPEQGGVALVRADP